MKLFKPFLYTGIAATLLVGCGTNNVDDTPNTVDRSTQPIGVRYDPANTGRSGVDEPNNVVLDQNNYNRMTNNGEKDGVNNTNDPSSRIRRTHMAVADSIADHITQLAEVEDAYVLVTNNNAYVAVKLNNNTNNELTDTIERKIAQNARERGNFDNVYVSENPDLYNKLTEYGERLQNGDPIEGLFDEFTNTVDRIFPTVR